MRTSIGKVSLVVALTWGSMVLGTTPQENARRERGDRPPPILQGDGATFQFLRSEFGPGDFKVVKGNPFSAEAVTETTRILADGNRIVRRGTTGLYRDGEGRTRRERVLDAVGPWMAQGEPHRLITIHDPVASRTVILEPSRRIARRAVAGEYRLFRAEDSANGNEASSEVVVVRRPPRGERVEGERIVHRMERFRFHRLPAEAEGNTTTQDLGVRTMEGVLSEGTRTVLTIPAGAIGNELPIEVVTERWYSPELETLVRSRHYDPRVGETVFRLENVERLEPDPSLFEIPSDFEIEDARGPEGPVRLRKQRD